MSIYPIAARISLTDIHHRNVLCRRDEKPANNKGYFSKDERKSSTNIVHQISTENASHWRTSCAQTCCKNDFIVKCQLMALSTTNLVCPKKKRDINVIIGIIIYQQCIYFIYYLNEESNYCNYQSSRSIQLYNIKHCLKEVQSYVFTK